MHSLLAQITDISGTNTEECFDVTMYIKGTITNENFLIIYDSLTVDEKAVVTAFTDLLSSKAPQ